MPRIFESPIGPPDKEARCTICGATAWKQVRREKDLFRPDSSPYYQLARCESCGVVMQLPLPAPEELARAYDGSYPAYQAAWRTAGWSLWTFLRAWTMRRRMALLSRHVSGSELLEVGSGGGDFLFAASRRGWHVCAVEYNATMADIARTELRLDVRSGEL